MAVEKNVLRYYIRSDGTFFPATENSGKIYPGSAYANLLDIYLEDGISENTFVQVNFLLDGKFVTEWLPTFNQGMETRVIENVSVPFTRFRLAIPPNVTQNASPTSTKQVGISVRQVYGDAWQGVYDDFDDLTAEVPPTKTLADDYATAYILTTEGENEDGFYQCQYDSEEEEYVWVAVTIANTYQEIKTYGVGNATLQKGWVSPKGTVTISDAIQNLIFVELSNIEQRVATLETTVEDLDDVKLEKDFGEYDPKTSYNGTDTIAINDDEDGGNPKEVALEDLMKAENMSFDNSATDLEATTVQDAVEELESDIIAVDEKVDEHIADETNPHNVTASQTTFTPTTDISSENVQDAIEEVRALFADIPLDNLYDFGSQSTPIEYILYLLATDAPVRALFHGRWNDEHLFGTSEQYGGGVLHATVISPTEVNVYEYDATSGPLGTITKTTSFATKIDKDISGYDSASPADANLIYIYDGVNSLKASLVAVKNYMLSEVISGDTLVGRANKDSSGNVITTTYATKTENNSKVSKILTGYSGLSSLTDSKRLYVDDSGTPKYTTVGTLKTYIAADFVSFGYEIATADVDGLPDVAEPLTNKIYLVLISEPDEDNVYNEFLYVDGSWELFGTTELNLVAENVTYNGSNLQTELDDINSALLTLLGE